MGRIIGFTGLAGAGKDTAALAMQAGITATGRTCRIDSFAAPIRSIADRVGLDPWDREGKERGRVLEVEAFESDFFYAIEETLQHVVSDGERASLFAFTLEALDPYTTGNYLSVSPRQFMQILGTEGGRAVRDDFWITSAVNRWRSMDGYTLATDCRFPDESTAVDRLILIDRPGVVAVNAHPSEAMAADLTRGMRGAKLPKVHATLLNDCDKPVFESRAESLGRALVNHLEH